MSYYYASPRRGKPETIICTDETEMVCDHCGDAVTDYEYNLDSDTVCCTGCLKSLEEMHYD